MSKEEAKEEGEIKKEKKDKEKKEEEEKPEEPPIPRKTQCFMCLTYDIGSIVIGAIDAAVTIIIVILVVLLSNAISDVELSPSLTRTLFAFPITALVAVFGPRIIGGILAAMSRSSLTYRRLHSVIRSVTSVLMFALSMSLLIILVLMYKGTTTLIQLTDVDISFIKSEKMKWGIILLALILILGTMLDLYFSLAVRTFYLTLLHYPDIMGNPQKEENNKVPLAS
jgi:hypothetical protein